MKRQLFLLMTAATMLLPRTGAAQNRTPQRNPDGPFKVTVGDCAHGHIEVTPAIPAEGAELPKGTVLHIRAAADPGYAFECGYKAMDGRFAVYSEYLTPAFEVTVDGNCSVGASFVEHERLAGHRCIHDIVYARPGVKPLKYDAFIPDGAQGLPGIVIIHGGAWTMNNEDVMKGLARELVKDGRYVVFSIDYRWNGTADGDRVPNTMVDLIEDCYGAILHIQEHAREYGLDPTRLAVTGDSAGGHLCAAVATMIEKVGDGGFGRTPGVYEFLPTYRPQGMSPAQARRQLLAIQAVAPNYGIFSVSGIRRFVRNLPEGAQEAVAPLNNIPDASLRKIPHWLNRGTRDALITDESTMEYVNALKAAGQEVHYILVPDAGHAYFDWKPDPATKRTFDRFGVPYARQMEDFFDTVFYK